MIKIALDVMGGDNAPDSIIEGAIWAAREMKNKCHIVLVGQDNVIHKTLQKYDTKGIKFTIVNATQVVGMHESPSAAFRQKKDSSIAIAIQLQKEGKADAIVSAGNTGLVMATSLLRLGRLKSVHRPAIAAILPTKKGYVTMLDVGANVDSKPLHLLQFAIMGYIYVNYMFNKIRPKVGLLSIGEESSKGNDLTQEVHKLLEKLKEHNLINFIGNVEGRDVLKGKADVVVCDGFVGNIVLKMAESMYEMIMRPLKDFMKGKMRGKIGFMMLKPVFDKLRAQLDYEEYGGAPLLGIKGVSIICHGSSGPRAIMNAIKVAHRYVSEKVNEHIEEQLKLYNEAMK